MVAPNGGRKTKAEHPAVPISIPELVDSARVCHAAGAQALHAHVRDNDGQHVLDAGLYRELLAECARCVPGMQVQITTEALGRYSPAQQRQLVRAVQPTQVSVALREQDPDGEAAEARDFYFWAAEAGLESQHILYSPRERQWLERLQDRGIIPQLRQRVLYVLGRYEDGLASDPRNVSAFVAAGSRDVRWMVCAFGQSETDCLAEAHALGGEMRVGFENNCLNRDGRVAADNAHRVIDLIAALDLHR
ncbi:3-keto-5-aminohexanoate cleavage protein [Aliiroseovarius sp.]|uniref:3-keto-5-aminohexanoate cleavage protein n=1 Tax=Aliiroseovarius sp. TaxID=1872442 RepID=UPI003BA94AE1